MEWAPRQFPKNSAVPANYWLSDVGCGSMWDGY